LYLSIEVSSFNSIHSFNLPFTFSI
jgi:hypothetical protein